MNLVNLAVIFSSIGLALAADTRGDIRLVDGPTSTEGRVEVFTTSWGSVCDEGWAQADANVTCQQLSCISALEATTGSKYGIGPLASNITKVDCGTGGPFHNLLDCSYQASDKNSTCTNKTQAGVKCNCGTQPTIGDDNEGSGVVMVTATGTTVKGGLCADIYDQRTADVACREAGFAGSTTIDSVNSTGINLLSIQIQCLGSEISLSACPQSEFNTSSCQTGAATTVCQRDDETSTTEVPTSEPEPSGLSAGATVGIIIGVAIALILVVLIIYCMFTKRGRGYRRSAGI